MSKADERLGPLRRIVKRFEEDGYTIVELECGHRERVSSRQGLQADVHKKPGARKHCAECLGGGDEKPSVVRRDDRPICPCCRAKLSSYNSGPLCFPCKEAGKTPPRKPRRP